MQGQSLRTQGLLRQGLLARGTEALGEEGSPGLTCPAGPGLAWGPYPAGQGEEGHWAVSSTDLGSLPANQMCPFCLPALLGGDWHLPGTIPSPALCGPALPYGLGQSQTHGSQGWRGNLGTPSLSCLAEAAGQKEEVTDGSGGSLACPWVGTEGGLRSSTWPVPL